ncbi:MAG: RNA polymerase-associated protein RapA, partial [Planctomycetes bacterium]|nr:RNA polymerase-associated protein RapA [Planctomycetota bacterium]
MPQASQFALNQRWYSQAEPELGIGVVVNIEGRDVEVAYPARGATFRYEMDGAPLIRANLSIGSQALSTEGLSFKVEVIEHDGPLLRYLGEGKSLTEEDLCHTIDLATPENRLFSYQCDSPALFNLRLKALQSQSNSASSKVRGFLGGRIQLYPHQLYIANEVCSRHYARILLADEVGLGKTIEAALIIHRMLLTGRIERVLVLVPPPLIHQWFAEFYTRFNLSLRIIDKEYVENYQKDFDSPFMADQLLICPLDLANEVPIEDSDWDMIVIDEAHHLEPGRPNFQLTENLAAKSPHILLLSATPEQTGEKGHFSRLQLLDPARFHSFEEYMDEQSSYRAIAEIAYKLKKEEKLTPEHHSLLHRLFGSLDLDELLEKCHHDNTARQELFSKLLDQHGIGRLMFRNVRNLIGGFPKRSFHPTMLDSQHAAEYREDFDGEFLYEHGIEAHCTYSHLDDRDPRIIWLSDFLKSHKGEKAVIICHNPTKTEAIASALQDRSRIKAARFHEGMSLMDRDRQAALFLDHSGPPCLISSPLGAEGRNFQNARHLILFDLPLEPEQLEQRIGRLDRIGQGFEIGIYTPHLEGSLLARLIQWYEYSLHAFDKPWHGCHTISDEFGEELLPTLTSNDPEAYKQLLDMAQLRTESILKEMESGRDRLLEYNSFDEKFAEAISEEVADMDDEPNLEEFMLEAYDRCGVNSEEIDFRTYELTAGLSYSRPFPGFNDQGMVVTFHRPFALRRDDVHYLSWDHPMVRDSLEMFVGSDMGNATVAKTYSAPPGLILETVFVAHSTLALNLHGDRFFPPTPIHLAVDMDNNEVS